MKSVKQDKIPAIHLFDQYVLFLATIRLDWIPGGAEHHDFNYKLQI